MLPTGRFQADRLRQEGGVRKPVLEARAFDGIAEDGLQVDVLPFDEFVNHTDPDVCIAVLQRKDPEISGKHFVDVVQFDLIGQSAHVSIVATECHDPVAGLVFIESRLSGHHGS